jgi:hypothetical protein
MSYKQRPQQTKNENALFPTRRGSIRTVSLYDIFQPCFHTLPEASVCAFDVLFARRRQWRRDAALSNVRRVKIIIEETTNVQRNESQDLSVLG